MHATAVPTVPVVGHETVAASANGEIATLADAATVFAFASVAVTEIVNVPLVL